MANFRISVDEAVFNILNVESMLALDLDGGAILGGVFNGVAPKRGDPNYVEPPFVIFQFMTNIPNWTFSKRFGDGRYLVKAVSKTPWPREASKIDTQIDTLMEDAVLTIPGFDQIECRRVQDVSFPEVDGSITWQHIGGIYRIQAGES